MSPRFRRSKGMFRAPNTETKKVRSWGVFRGLNTFLEGIWSPRVSSVGCERSFGKKKIRRWQHVQLALLQAGCSTEA